MKQHAQHGFTLVELLIVIVVLTILTTLTVFSYQGITRQAENDARFAEIAQAAALLEQYKIVHKDYPGITAGEKRCIGTGFPNGKCGTFNSSDPTIAFPETNTELTDKLAAFG